MEFYTRVGALLAPHMRVVDFGAGRAEWFEDDPSEFRRVTRLIKGRVREVVACDVDDAVLTNRAADRCVLLTQGAALPFADGSVDVVIADYVFEHVQEPAALAAELTRILAPGGWICARTPNALGYVALASRLVGNRRHVRALQHAQPDRKAIDVFPTVYKLNTLRAIREHFPPQLFADFSYRFDPEPAYFFGSLVLFRVLQALHWVLPPQCASQLLVFLRRR